MPWLTPANPPDHQSVVRRILLPADNSWTSVFDGMLLDLCYARNWEKHGDMTPQEAADWWWAKYTEFTTDFDETPYSDNPDELDGEPKLPWYENLYDWIIAGFLAITFTPQAAIVYQATVPKLRIAFRTGNIGALFKVLINGVEVWTGDSYGPIVDVIERVFDTSAYTPPYTVRIEHNGSGENVVGEAKLEYIRQDAVAAMVATILRADPEGCGIQWSQDNGDTWATVDLASCITGLANSAIQQAIDDGRIGAPGQQQGPQPAPQPGECKTYHVALSGNQVWHCPSPVQAGYVITVDHLTGGWSDGTSSWMCPDGSTYLLGECYALGKSHDEGDPINPGAYHMQLIGKYAETFFLPSDAPFTVPEGTEATSLLMQANDATLSDNLGMIQFDCTVCTPAVSSCTNIDTVFADNNYGGWRAGSVVNDFDIGAYYGAPAATWQFSFNGQVCIYGEGYSAGNFGIFGVKELGTTCSIAAITVNTPDIPVSQNIVSVHYRKAGTWVHAGSANIGQNGGVVFTVTDAGVDAIAVGAYGNYALYIARVRASFE